MAAVAEAALPPQTIPGRSVRRRVSPLGFGAVGLLVLIVAAVALGPRVWEIDPLEQQIEQRLETPSRTHPLGTDQFGRDILARLLTGGRWTLAGAAAVCVGVSLSGFVVGALAASGSRLTDSLLGRLIALVITNWPWYARAYRSIILKERAAPYVDGAVALGAGRWRIIGRHILPNAIGLAVVLATTNLGNVILGLAALSFLGLGLQPPTPEWGVMINDALDPRTGRR